jgi:citrate lyase beta subunit
MRSKLFVPAIRPDLFEKALSSGSDAVCFDLEDAVPWDKKAEARTHLQAFLEFRVAKSPDLLVRTNPVDSADFLLDLEAVVWPSLTAIALPKVRSADEIRALEEALTKLEATRHMPSPLSILPTIESARGLRLAAEIAEASSRIIGLQLGFADLLEPLGIAGDNRLARDQIRLMLRLAAAEAGVDCCDSAFADFRNTEAFQMHLAAGREYGFAGASCIHPSQIAATNRAYTPTEAEIAYARRVVAAAAEAVLVGSSVTSVDGKMIDLPFVMGAERLLARAHERPTK